MKFTCPRRKELGSSSFGVENQDFYLADDTCTYCGSLNQDIFMAHLEKADIRLGPTDKNYKVYVEGIPNPDAGKPAIYSSANCEQTGKGWVKVTPENIDTLPLSAWQRQDFNDGKHWVKVEPARAMLHHKFYFQHLSEDQCKRFVQLLNNQQLLLDYPGYFYRMPFFCKFDTKANEAT